MSYYKLYRDKAEGKAVRGTLYMCQPGKLGETLLVKAASTLENANKMIPAMVYPVAVTISPRFGKLLPLVRNVPGRTGIRMHGGIKPEHSQGCILLNRKAEYQAVVERLLYEQKKCEDIRLEIIDWYPGRDQDYQKQIIDYPKYTDYEKISTNVSPHRGL